MQIWPATGRVSFAGTVELDVPVQFSMIENPEGTLAFLSKLRDVVVSPKVSRIKLNHKTCEHTDLCASVLMDVLLINGQSHWRRTRQSVVIEGNMPNKDHPLHVLLVNSGVVAHLVKPVNIPSELTAGIKTFKLVKGGKTSPLKSARKEVIATELAAYFDGCLRTMGFQLKAPAQGLLTSIVSEVLDNAELHGNADGKWYAIGYFNPNAANAVDSSCHIVLFNFGDTLHQTLKRSPKLRKRMAELADIQNGPWWNFSTKFKESTIWSLFALQEGVSRLSDDPNEIGRGSGTVDMIEFFHQLSGGEQRMCVVSGDAYILNDGTFKPGKDSQNNTVLAFNADNDLSKPPDSRFVRALERSFPGTLISLRFPFNREHLEKLSLEAIAASDSEAGLKPLVVYYDGTQKA